MACPSWQFRVFGLSFESGFVSLISGFEFLEVIDDLSRFTHIYPPRVGSTALVAVVILFIGFDDDGGSWGCGCDGHVVFMVERVSRSSCLLFLWMYHQKIDPVILMRL